MSKNSSKLNRDRQFAMGSLRKSDSVEEAKVTPAKLFDKAAFLARIRKCRTTIPLTEATVASMREQVRY
jgi:hypothetical protein